MTVFETLIGIAQIVIATALLGFGMLLLAALFLAWKLYKKVKKGAEKLRVDVDPALRNAIALTETARGMAASVQGNVAEISRNVSDANQKIGRVVESAERRAAELGALLDVAQQEAEELFVRTASTLRGVRAGAGALRSPRGDGPMDHEISDDELEIRIRAHEAGHAPGLR
ncbi:MAG: hypothetical protein AVDCRST_MAG68-317 [uncultured Gemmatimonadetes bacterium]|uniref:Uncharacterized protein n=1 Tax=uncultured Gemmatimonadota bacterium TaxID=203437 RepID=A0A6J4KA49_9BACT|nr:MAG: hypothetical protein AVDCRST_MAG68-317 [uncultured Gemmatimonadota bacterium]